MRTTIKLFLFLYFGVVFSVATYADLSDELFTHELIKIKNSVELDEVERMYLYITVKGKTAECNELSSWVDVVVDEATDVAVWMNVKKTLNNINEYLKSISHCKGSNHTFYLLHTHPKKSIKKNYKKSKLFNDGYKVNWSQPLTVPPSMSDLGLIITFNSILKESIVNEVEFNLIGAVVDPANIYFYRTFKKGEAKMLFPEVEVIDFSILDNEERSLQYDNLTKEIESSAAMMSTQLNSDPENILNTFETLQKAYVKYNFYLKLNSL